MRVAFDARELEARPTGVGRVLDGLLGAWPDDDRLLLVARRDVGEPRPRCESCVESGPSWLPGSVWEQVFLPRAVARLRADCLVCPAYGMPWRAPCPTAVGMHDCAFASVPETFRARERWRRKLTAGIAARRACFLFMGSRFAAAEARRQLGTKPDRLLVLPYGADRRFRPPGRERVDDVRRRYGLAHRPVLFAGAQLSRRRLPGIAEALARIVADRPDAQLCVAGPRPAADEAEVLSSAARWLGYVADEDLPALYAAAAVVVYPSRYEGFGLPVLEALACGTPVITADIGALAEIYREHARVLPVDDPSAWARALEALLDDPDERATWVRRGAAWAQARDWTAAAHLLRERLVAAAEAR